MDGLFSCLIITSTHGVKHSTDFIPQDWSFLFLGDGNTIETFLHNDVGTEEASFLQTISTQRL